MLPTNARKKWVQALGWVCLIGTLLHASRVFCESTKSKCFQAVLEGKVSAGQGFDQVFAPGLRFYLEPLRSGWIIRVLAANAPRGPHDFAELATPPYQSVSPLLVSTDWAFRAQDAVAWNPRHFRYAANQQNFVALKQWQDRAMKGEGEAMANLGTLVSTQPEAKLELLNARFAPGLADQAKMASAVALHLANTSHETDLSAGPSPLGKLEAIQFRVVLDLPSGVHAAKGVAERAAACPLQPTTSGTPASQHTHGSTNR